MVKNNSSRIMNGNGHTNEHMITLNIRIPHDNMVHSMQFDVQMSISDICHNIQQHLMTTVDHDRKKNDLIFITFYSLFFKCPTMDFLLMILNNQ